MAQNYSLLIESADDIVWDSGHLHRNPKVYATVSLDDNPVSQTPVFKRSLQPKWNFNSNLFKCWVIWRSCPLISTITLRLYHHTFLPRREDPIIGEGRISIEELLHQCGSGKGDVPALMHSIVIQLKVKADGKVSGRLFVLLEKSEVAAGRAEGRMESALLKTSTTAGPNLDRIDAAVEAGGAQSDLIHPYVSAAWSILSSVYQAVKQQREMDDKVVELVKTMVELYSFKDNINFVVEKIPILEDTLVKIAKQTLECANFLEEYSQPKFAERAIRTAFVNDNQRKIDDLSEELVKLKESFTHSLRIQNLSLTTEIHGTVVKLGWSIPSSIALVAD
ncbi:hypothetical protein C8F04DRAFT_1199031 [Mycena alexandri]|uniref:C2 domain-containing protein n=1 Tax=Mycena alexandri TaxID=1745969 RepID=A0AAD6WRM3_9AGAR|nr:hypothetical protein C8F04DRAFT_1199031 [Mycena alexandri]